MKNYLLICAIQLICGITFSQTTESKPEPAPKQDLICDIVDEPASFPGGSAALIKYLAENMIYPQTAAENGIQGKCFLQFYVMKDGSIQDVKIKKGVPDCPECDAEAIRLVKGMPKWIPGKINGKAVNSTFNLPVSFRLS